MKPFRTPIHVVSECRIVASVSTSRSRDGLETYQRLISVSAIYVSCPRQFPDGHADGAVRSVNGI